jgi:hypothetical protein
MNLHKLSLKFRFKAVPQHSMMALGGEEVYLLLIIDLGTRLWEWSASRPGRALPRKGPPVPIVQEARWAPELVWTLRLEEKLFASAGDRTRSSITKRHIRAVTWLRRLVAGLSLRSPGFEPRSIHVGFVVEKVALGQVFLRVLRFSPVNIIPPSLSNSYHHQGDEQYVRYWQQFRDVVLPHQNQSFLSLLAHAWRWRTALLFNKAYLQY